MALRQPAGQMDAVSDAERAGSFAPSDDMRAYFASAGDDNNTKASSRQQRNAMRRGNYDQRMRTVVHRGVGDRRHCAPARQAPQHVVEAVA